MFLYVGEYWVEFPSSEYGGLWVVMAENDEQCIELLRDARNYFGREYDDEIPEAVQKAKRFQLDENVEANKTPQIVDTFFT